MNTQHSEHSDAKIMAISAARLGISYTDIAELIQEKHEFTPAEWQSILDAYESNL